MSTKTVIAGGWTAYHQLTAEDQKVFNEAMKDHHNLGVKYTPQSVATQVVAGINYRFKCEAEPVVLEPIQWEAIVEIFQPLGKETPYVTGIQKL